MTITEEIIRIAFDPQNQRKHVDEITGRTPEMWWNNDVAFQCGFFRNEEPIDASPFQSVKLIVKEVGQRQAAVPLMQKVIGAEDIIPVFTAEEWAAGSQQHCVIRFTAEETRLVLGDQDEKEFWLALIATTTEGQRVTLGATILKLFHDGEDVENNAPPLGSSLIAQGASYNGSGQYVVTGLTAGRTYALTLGDNDTKLVNGAEELTASGNFTANGTSVTLEGDASALVTATLRYPVYLTQDEADARYQRAIKPWAISPNGRWMRMMTIDNNGKRIDQVIDLHAL